jgi:PKD repeat protein
MQTASVIPSTGDGSNYYYIAPGQTRQFTYSGVITNSNNYSSASTYTVQVSGISYGTNTNNLSSNSVTSGLSNLQVTASFNGGTTQQPTVTSINPTSGPVGSQITINGNNFQTGSVLKISGPSLNNFGVIPNSVSPTQIIAYMPSQATYSGVYAIYVSNGNVTSNTVQFTIQSTSTQPPVITGGTFPTTLQVNQTGAWSVSAYDPQNGSLSYAVDWGDNAPKPAYVTQTTAFTHSYSAAGNYTVKFTVTNSAGLTAQTSATVQVANPITATCPVGYICGPVGQAISCPSGYICTNVTANCPSGYICSVANKVTSSPSPTPTPSSSSSPSPSSSSAPQAVQYDAGSQPAAAVQSTGSGFWSTLFKSLGF